MDLFLVGEQHFTSTRWLAKRNNFVARDQSSQGKSSIVKVPQHRNHFTSCLRHIRFSTWAKKLAKSLFKSKQIAITESEEIIHNLTGTNVWRKLRRTLRIAYITACENIRFSSLFVCGDVSRGGSSATQRQKFHTDDVKSLQNPGRSADWSTE